MSFLVWVYTSQDFAQTQQNFARLHDRVTVTFRNSAIKQSPTCWGSKARTQNTIEYCNSVFS